MMPWDILKKGVLFATFIHLLLFIAITVPSSTPSKKKFVRVSLYTFSPGKGGEKIQEAGEEVRIREVPEVQKPSVKEEVKKPETVKPEPSKNVEKSSPKEKQVAVKKEKKVDAGFKERKEEKLKDKLKNAKKSTSNAKEEKGVDRGKKEISKKPSGEGGVGSAKGV